VFFHVDAVLLKRLYVLCFTCIWARWRLPSTGA
jgi:hypothetical protein